MVDVRTKGSGEHDVEHVIRTYSFLGIDAAAAWREHLLLGAGSESASAGSSVMSRFLGGGIASGLAACRGCRVDALLNGSLLIGHDEAVFYMNS